MRYHHRPARGANRCRGAARLNGPGWRAGGQPLPDAPRAHCGSILAGRHCRHPSEAACRQAAGAAWDSLSSWNSRPGAGGNIGTAFVARAKEDPYTLLLGSSGPLAISPTIEGNLGYNPLTDLTPIALVAATPLVLTVPASSPFRDLHGMTRALREAGREVLYPTPGVGSPQLLAGRPSANVSASRRLRCTTTAALRW